MNDEQEIILKLTISEFYELSDALSFAKGELMRPGTDENLNRQNRARAWTLHDIQEKIWSIRADMEKQNGEE